MVSKFYFVRWDKQRTYALADHQVLQHCISKGENLEQEASGSSPGVFLGILLDKLNLNYKVFAAETGVNENVVSCILKGWGTVPITGEIAARFEHYFKPLKLPGTKAMDWMYRQAKYELEQIDELEWREIFNECRQCKKTC